MATCLMFITIFEMKEYPSKREVKNVIIRCILNECLKMVM